MRHAALTSFAMILAASATAFGQDEIARKQAVEIATRVPLEKTMTGAPYSADTVVEGIQTLADGNRIVRKTTGRVYRDGEGRTRREDDGGARNLSVATGNVTVTVRTSISIVDPVGGFSYSLDPERKIAWRTPIGTAGTIIGKLEAAQVEERRKAELEKMLNEKAATLGDAEKALLKERLKERMADDPQSAADREKLAIARGGGRGGSLDPGAGEVRMRGNAEAYAFAADNPAPLERKILEGVMVEGRKTTVTIPAGQVGNERPLTIVSEEWRSPELNVLVMTRHLDPRTGESAYRLTNIIRAEPDRSLFMVPPDYEIRESGVRRMLEQPQRE